jgi:hypothetical protein
LKGVIAQAKVSIPMLEHTNKNDCAKNINSCEAKITILNSQAI